MTTCAACGKNGGVGFACAWAGPRRSRRSHLGGNKTVSAMTYTNNSTTKRAIMSGDCWKDDQDHSWQIDEPSLADLDHALLRLDAETYTMIMITGEGDSHLGVGGGKGQYVVYASFLKDDFWNLLRPEATDGTIFITICGQEGGIPSRQVVDLEHARSAAHVFLLQHQRDPSQTWEHQE
jgi:hypothetical protein